MKKGQVLMVIMLIILILVLVFLVYFIYQYFPGEAENINAVFSKPKLETGNLSYVIRQFYPNMKFNHNSISYKIDSECSAEKRERMIKAFNELQNKIGIISFYEGDEPDIDVSCSKKAEHEVERDYFIAGEGGAREIIRTGRYNVITNGVILLYGEEKGVKCDWPNIELHELLHVFGFDHSTDEESLMYPHLESCNQKLDESIINDLKQLYSEENLADLYFDEVTAVKKGIYLDFNVTVKNSGVIDAKNVVLSVFDDGKNIKDFQLGEIPFGASVIYYVTYLKLRSRSSDDIEIVIDNSNLVEEIDEQNNIAELVFS